MTVHTTTPWIPGHLKPVRRGLYERRTTSTSKRRSMWSMWDGVAWRSNRVNRFEAEGAKQQSLYQDLPWRGLTREARP